MGVPAGPFICDGLLWKAEHMVLPWMAERIQGLHGRVLGDDKTLATAFGVLGGDRIVGGVAFAFWHDSPEGGDIEVSSVFEPGARVTPRMWRHLYGYAFVQLNCRRISCQTTRRNKAARQHAERMGFRLEGVRREGWGRQDLMLYGLLRSDMRNGLPPIKRRPRHG